MAYYEKRIKRLQALLAKLDLDGLLVADGYNMRYLTGFTGGTGDGLVIVTKDGAALITDDRYRGIYQNNLPDGVAFEVTRDYFGQAVQSLIKAGVHKLGFEASMAYRDFELLDEILPADIDFDAVPDAIETLREVKDEVEMDALRRAAHASVQAFNDLLNFIKVGQTELEVANELDRLQKKYGAEKPSFDTIVASGYRSALPHGAATDKVIEKGDLVTIDFGYYVDGYTSDVTRTIAMGDIDPKLEEIYQIVLQANKDAIAMVKPGVSTDEIDRVARDYISEHGYGEYYNHATGHGAGLYIHEGPVLRTNDGEEVLAGNLLTIEPGIYLPDLGGVRIEDDVLVTPEGHENLTAGIDKNLIKIEA
ncbi:aminopeptidase P family protein [Eupransor demetentiae]|uniref:Xaa-Pro aminopeptidase (PepP) n=1 Tax=Eupransor demetentiae TaxID=3109584 RepID=A0ABP0ENB7_9LACO|nr:Xaa-Pro aminopeptidase (PepP) [Lactobacillaceae bacterium LMG 33000]